ncbi:MAG: DMT family transporter [Deltaproteobacteria bacterium]|nr:DMT family transporter [Deltaproteobacteria bacterium]
MSNRSLGIVSFVIHLWLVNANDIYAKYLEQELPFLQVSFFLFFFSFVTIVPVALFQGMGTFRTQTTGFHFLRSAVLFAATLCWYWGLETVQITAATVISFSITLFLLPLASLILKEKVGIKRVVATMIGFIGVLIVVGPFTPSFDPMVSIMLLGAFFYALLEIMNKKHLETESIVTMILYASLFASLLTLGPAISVWKTPSSMHMIGLFVIGLMFNIVLFFLLKALSLEDASFLAPFMYLEIVFSVVMGYAVFGETPHVTTIIGGIVIVGGTLYIMVADRRETMKAVSR